MKVDKQKIVDLCVNRLGFNNVVARSFADSFPQEIHKELEKAYTSWVEESTVSDEEILPGLTIKRLMEVRKCNFLDAVQLVNRYLDSDVSEEKRHKASEELLKPTIVW